MMSIYELPQELLSVKDAYLINTSMMWASSKVLSAKVE